MVCKTFLAAIALGGLSAAASAPIPQEIQACSTWIKSTTKTPSSFLLKSYGGRGRVISAEQVKRHILGNHSKMVNPANGETCAFMASISYDIQNPYGATVRETSTCTVLIRDGQAPDVAITSDGDRVAWREFSNNPQKCGRLVQFIPQE